MRKFKVWLILISVGLIAFDKYSFISNFRDSVVIWMQKTNVFTVYRIELSTLTPAPYNSAAKNWHLKMLS